MRKLIGKGSFTKAYQIAEYKVEVISICPAKECYALFSQGNTFAPVIEKIDYRDDGYSVYHMPLYKKVTAPKKQLNKEAYAIYQTLRKMSDKFGMNYNVFCQEVEATTLDEDVKEEILNLVGDVCNAIDCFDMGFEISPRNIAVGEGGNLIMLDCFFSRKLLKTTWKH